MRGKQRIRDVEPAFAAGQLRTCAFVTNAVHYHPPGDGQQPGPGTRAHTSLSHVDGRISVLGLRDVTTRRRGWSAMSVRAVAARDSTGGAAGQQ